MRYTFWAVVKDPGGIAGLLPVVWELEHMGQQVLLVANGKATELLCGKGHEYVVAEKAEDLLEKYELPRVLLTSMCSGGGTGRNLVPYLRDKSIIVAFQDIWGGQLLNDWSDPKYRPDFIVTNDEVGKRIVLEHWSDFGSEQVWTTGFPALDAYAGIDVAAVGCRARAALGLDEHTPLVFFAGQGYESAHALGEVACALDGLGLGAYLLPRPHPRTKDNFASEMVPWQQALARFKGQHVVDYFGQCTNLELIAAAAQSGVMVSMYSTMLVEAAALRGNAISVLYPDHGLRDMREYIAALKQFPLVELGCAVVTANRAELGAALKQALQPNLGLRRAQERYIRVDGQNAHRAADQLALLLE